MDNTFDEFEKNWFSEDEWTQAHHRALFERAFNDLKADIEFPPDEEREAQQEKKEI